MSFSLSASPENVPDNLSEERHVFRIVQNAILLVFGERLVFCHKKGFAIKTHRKEKSISVSMVSIIKIDLELFSVFLT